MAEIINAKYTNATQTQIKIYYSNGKEIAIPATKTDTRYIELNKKWVTGNRPIQPFKE